jgi:methionyl-tRNA formyltransferase
MTRVLFLGTPSEALPALVALHDRYQVDLVITQPDRPRGRSRRPVPPPVKEHATKARIEVAQPETTAELVEVASGYGVFDLGVVVAYGRILPPAILYQPRMGILNIHFSLLPRWRGAAPVARALMAGDTMTGVTIIGLDEGLDTGPVLTAQAVDIHPAENAGTLTERLAILGARLLITTIPGYLSGETVPVAQSDDGATYAPKITAEDRPLGGDDDPAVFLGRVRGLAPSPGALLEIDGDPHKILAARVSGRSPDPGRWEAQDGFPVVGVGGVGVTLTLLQSPGRRPQSGDDWVRGRHRFGGVVR